MSNMVSNYEPDEYDDWPQPPFTRRELERMLMEDNPIPNYPPCQRCGTPARDLTTQRSCLFCAQILYGYRAMYPIPNIDLTF